MPFTPVRYIPEWMPGARFKKNARIWGNAVLESSRTPFNATLDAFVCFNVKIDAYLFLTWSIFKLDGTAEPSFTKSWLLRINSSSWEGEKKKVMQSLQLASGVSFLAGFETVSIYV
jgi:hypothetical protein